MVKIRQRRECRIRAVGDKQTGTVRAEFDRSISIDFQGAKITTDTGFLVMREVDQRFNISGAASQLNFEQGFESVWHIWASTT